MAVKSYSKKMVYEVSLFSFLFSSSVIPVVVVFRYYEKSVFVIYFFVKCLVN